MAIRPRIIKVGSAYRREVNSGTCELCFAEWTATIRDVSFGLDAADDDSATGAIKTSPELLPATVEHLCSGWSSRERRLLALRATFGARPRGASFAPALHPIGMHDTPSDRVQRPPTGAASYNPQRL